MELDVAAIQRMLDKEAIREASLRYTRGIDRHDDGIMGQAYHPGATDDHGAYIGDAAGFIAHAKDVHSRNWAMHQHYIGNQSIDLDGDTAHVETYFLAALRRPAGPVDLVGGRYVDRFERRDGCWAIADRICLVEWNGELPATQTTMDPDLFVRGSWDRSDVSYERPLRPTRPPRDLDF